jgi:hypothetical protein
MKKADLGALLGSNQVTPTQLLLVLEEENRGARSMIFLMRLSLLI